MQLLFQVLSAGKAHYSHTVFSTHVDVVILGPSGLRQMQLLVILPVTSDSITALSTQTGSSGKHNQPCCGAVGEGNLPCI